MCVSSVCLDDELIDLLIDELVVPLSVCGEGSDSRCVCLLRNHVQSGIYFILY